MVFTIKTYRNVILALLLTLVIGCDSSKKKNKEENNELTKVSLRQEWFPYAGYAGEVMALNKSDEKYGLELILEAGSDNIDPIKLVTSGSNDFGVASADRIFTANEKGADLVAIGVINVNSPTCFIAKKEKNIVSPKDFENKTVGILTGTNTEYVYKALKRQLNLDDKKITEIEIPFDLGTFILGKYDVRPAFIYDETVSLDKQGIEYSIIEPKDYGISFLGTVYFTRRDLVENNPKLVQSFINSIAQGWELALQNPKEAIDYLKKYDANIDVNRELASLNKGLSYFEGEDDNVLSASLEKWKTMGEMLKTLGIIKNFDLSKSVNKSFVDKFHSK